jgi:hypothetical protein
MGLAWSSDGGLCPICGGVGRGSARYPAALCASCQLSVFDENGHAVQLFNESVSGGLEIKTGNESLTSPASEHLPLYANGTECRAREGRFGGVVVQPLHAWKAFGES